MTSKLPFGGELVRLGNLIKPAKVERCGSRDLPVLSMTMHDGITRQSDRFKKTIASRDTSAYKVVRPGQLVVGFPINEGVIYVQNFETSGIMSPAYKVWDVDSKRILAPYLEAVLHSPQSMAYYAKKMRGTTARRRTITDANLLAMQIPLPNFEGQFRAVKSLARIKGHMAIAGQQIDALSELVKSRFVEMFGDGGWPEKRVSDLATDIRYGTSKKASEEGAYTYLRMNNMTDDGRLDFSDTKRITLEGGELEKCLVKRGDVLFNRTNSREKVGKTAVFENDVPMVIAGYIIRVRFGEKMRSRYFSVFMNLPTTKKMLRDMAKGAVHQANISAKQLGAIEVPVPPIDLQDEFLAFAEQSDKSRVVAQKQKETLQTLYDSLAQDYFAI